MSAAEGLGFRAGAACVSLEPPLGLSTVGYARRYEGGKGYGIPLEVTAVALESGSERVAIVGVDTLGMQAPEANVLRVRVAEACGADPAGVLLNWSHTHSAPIGRAWTNLGGLMRDELAEAEETYVWFLHEKVVSVVLAAVARLEPARLLWGVGRCEEAVNRRERDESGRMIVGWDPDGVVDTDVVVLQLRRPDESSIGTVVGYGCHPLTVGYEVLDYSADFPGVLREAVRGWTGGECVFLQGAGANVIPLISFCDHEREAVRLGRAVAVQALGAVSAAVAGPARLVRSTTGSLTPFAQYRFEPLSDLPVLASAEERVSFPLLSIPSADEIRDLRAEFEGALAAASAEGADEGRLNTLRYHANWARRTEQRILEGTVPTHADGSIHALRIGDGAIVTGPGEVFTEIGLAVREQSPAAVTLYAGYTNGAIGYLPTAKAFDEGGYEPEYSYRGAGLPAPVAPDCERILVETGVRLVQSLFPDSHTPETDGSATRLEKTC